MNDEDLRLLQAAALGFTAMPTDDNLELKVADLSADEINAALQVLAGVMEHDDKSQDPPQPGESTSDPDTATANSEFGFDTTEDSLSNLKKLLGFSDPDADIAHEIPRQHNVSSVVRGMDNQPPEIDYEGQLADLQKSLAELSHPVTRISSPPTQEAAAPGLDQQTATNLANWISGLIHPTTTPFVAAQPQSRTRQSSITDPFEDPVKAAEKERIRVENRERKKKWRNQNQERNKDNDLRCRVTKRAAQLYGNATSLEKTHWIEREFNRRRSKRVTRKEQRIVDNPADSNSNIGCSGVFPAFSNSNSSSPPPSFSSVNAGRGDYMPGEGPQPREEMVDVMHLLAALSGEPGMLATLMNVAVANGYSEEALAAQCREDSTFNGSVGSGDGIETHNLTELAENIGVLAGTLNAWTPKASSAPVAASASQEPQQLSQSREEMERINRIEAGFEDLVANLERGLKEHRDNQNNGNQEVKSSPKSPNPVPIGYRASNYSSTSTPILEDLGLENMENMDNIGNAIADLLKGRSEGAGGVSVDETGEVEFSDEDIQRLIAEGGADVEMLLSSMEADGTATATQAQEVVKGGGDAGVEDYIAEADDRMELAQQIKRTGHAPNPAPEGQPKEGESPGFAVDGDDLPMADRMTLEEINSLLADLNGDADSGPMQLDAPIDTALQHAPIPPAPAPAPLPVSAPAPLAQPLPFNPDPDTSALYTKDTIVAIFKAILEMSPAPPPRATKRHSTGTHGNTSSTKRYRGHTPGSGMSMNATTMAALNQLNGLLSSSGFLHHNPHVGVPTNMQSQAYVASFGTTDGMNKRLIAMKPPPYRPGGSGVSGGGAGGTVGTGVQVKRKTGEEEKKVRAMGFPPLMAGMKRKL